MKGHDQNLRRKVLERDNYECQLSKLFGIAHLSGMPCVEEMEVHHITYERFGEELEKDLISVCRRCHDFLTTYIRTLRFTQRGVEIVDTEIQKLPEKTLEGKYNEDIEIPIEWGESTFDTQRTIGRPGKYLGQEDQGDLLKSQEDGRRF